MKLSLSFFADNLQTYFTLYSKKDKMSFFAKQALYLPLSLFGAAYVSQIPIFHTVVAFGSLIKQPSKHRLKTLHTYYKIPQELKPKFSWKSAALTTGIFAGLSLSRYDSVFEPMIEAVNSGTLHSFFKGVNGLFNAALYYEMASLSTHFIRTLSPMGNSLFKKSFYRAAVHSYFNEAETDSSEGIALKTDYLLAKEPRKGLAAIIEQRFEDGYVEETDTFGLHENILFHTTGTQSLSGFITSLMQKEFFKYRPYMFEKAVEDALEKKDISSLSLLGLYEYHQENKTTILDKQVKLLFEDTQLKKKFFGTGRSTDAYVHEYGDEIDPIKLTLTHKPSLDKSFLLEKQKITNIVAKEYPRNTSKIINVVAHNDIYFLTELFMRHPLLSQKLSSNPALLQDAYTLLLKFQDTILDSDEISLEKLDLVKKYLTHPLVHSFNYRKSIEETQKIYDKINDYKPVLDFHVDNLICAPDRLIQIDLENKGLSSTMNDIVNITDLSHLYLPYSSLRQEQNSIFLKYQEKINIDIPDLEKSYLLTMGNRLKSILLARRNENGFDDVNNIKLLLKHAGGVFEDYTLNSTQKHLASNQLNLVQELYTLCR